MKTNISFKTQNFTKPGTMSLVNFYDENHKLPRDHGNMI